MQLSFVLCVAVAALALVAVEAAKDPRECEVCIKVVDRVMEEYTKKGGDIKDFEAVENAFRKACKGIKNTDENRFCYFIGGTEDAATCLLRELSGPLSRHVPSSGVCQKLKKKDNQICELRYNAAGSEGSSDSATQDWKKLDLEKQKVKTLKSILEENFNGDQCTGCVEKADFIKRIRDLQKKSEL